MTGPPPMAPIPARAGIGLRSRHLPEFLAGPQPVAWLEVHAENYLDAGGARVAALETIRRDYPLSIHGVGLSLGGAEPVDSVHLARVAALVDRCQPGLVSDHVAWSVTGGVYFNDLLPIPYTEEALAALCRNIDQVQSAFGRRLLIENPSTYLRFAESVIPEPEFIAEAVRRTGCGVLLDVNNIQVSAVNHGDHPPATLADYLKAIPAEAVGEIHIAGHWTEQCDGQRLLIDDHGTTVAPEVWALLDTALDHLGPRPVLVEWDTRVPELGILLGEATTAEARIERIRNQSRRDAA